MEPSREQPIPLYYQLKTRLIEEILSGAYGRDGRLPTEHELCERFGMSRTPVTHALSELAAEGVVLRRRRHGTFVNPHWPARRARSGEVRVLLPAGERWAEHFRMVAPPDMRLSVAEAELNDLHAIFVRAVAEGRAPDLAVLDSVWMAEFAASGFLWPLEDLDRAWIESDYSSDFLQPFVDAHRFGGETLAVQAEMDVGGMWYNRADLAKVGASSPQTWAELKDVGRRLVESGTRKHALVAPGGPAADEFTTYCLVTLLASNGARVLGPDGVMLDSPATVQAMELLRSLANDLILPSSAVGYERQRPIQMLARGEAAIGLGGSYEAPTLARLAGISVEAATKTFGFEPVPAGPEGSRSVLVGGFVYCIPRQAKQPGLAMELLKSAVTPAAMARFFARTGQIPPRRSAVAELIGRSPFHAFTAGLLADAVTRPVTPSYALVSAQLRAMVEAVLTGRFSPEKAVGRAADLISAITGLPVMRLFVVPAGSGGVDAAAGERPAHDAGLRLLESPVGRVFRVMMPGAQGCQIALICRPGRVRGGVVEFVVDGPGIAAGRRARHGAGADQVAQLAARPVPVFAPQVITGSLRDRGEGDSQLAQQFGQPCPLSVVRSGPGAAATGVFGGPWVLSAGAAVGDGFAILADDRYAPS
jgi:multiple sugar transport system substrate-binding protein